MTAAGSRPRAQAPAPGRPASAALPSLGNPAPQTVYDIASYIFDHGHGASPSVFQLALLCKAVAALSLPSLGVVPPAPAPAPVPAARKPRSKRRSRSSSPPSALSSSITYHHIHEDERVSLGIFVLPPGAVIPLHDHPGMTVVSRVLYGKLHIDSYDWAARDGGRPEQDRPHQNLATQGGGQSPPTGAAHAGGQSPPTGAAHAGGQSPPTRASLPPSGPPSSPSPPLCASPPGLARGSPSAPSPPPPPPPLSPPPGSGFRLARAVHDRVFTSDDPPVVLLPHARGNVHRFRALTHTAVLDVMSPPYDPDDGRDCTYYERVAVEGCGGASGGKAAGRAAQAGACKAGRGGRGSAPSAARARAASLSRAQSPLLGSASALPMAVDGAEARSEKGSRATSRAASRAKAGAGAARGGSATPPTPGGSGSPSPEGPGFAWLRAVPEPVDATPIVDAPYRGLPVVSRHIAVPHRRVDGSGAGAASSSGTPAAAPQTAGGLAAEAPPLRAPTEQSRVQGRDEEGGREFPARDEEGGQQLSGCTPEASSPPGAGRAPEASSPPGAGRAPGASSAAPAAAPAGLAPLSAPSSHSSLSSASSSSLHARGREGAPPGAPVEPSPPDSPLRSRSSSSAPSLGERGEGARASGAGEEASARSAGGTQGPSPRGPAEALPPPAVEALSLDPAPDRGGAARREASKSEGSASSVGVAGAAGAGGGGGGGVALSGLCASECTSAPRLSLPPARALPAQSFVAPALSSLHDAQSLAATYLHAPGPAQSLATSLPPALAAALADRLADGARGSEAAGSAEEERVRASAQASARSAGAGEPFAGSRAPRLPLAPDGDEAMPDAEGAFGDPFLASGSLPTSPDGSRAPRSAFSAPHAPPSAPLPIPGAAPATSPGPLSGHPNPRHRARPERAWSGSVELVPKRVETRADCREQGEKAVEACAAVLAAAVVASPPGGGGAAGGAPVSAASPALFSIPALPLAAHARAPGPAASSSVSDTLTPVSAEDDSPKSAKGAPRAAVQAWGGARPGEDGASSALGRTAVR